MIRSFDGAALNTLVNDPSIRPHAGDGGGGFLDLGPFLDDPFNHFLAADKGGLLFQWTAPDIYEVHIMVLPEGRGKWALEFGHFGLGYMARQGARQLWARIPESNRRTQFYARKMGFAERGEKVFDLGAGPLVHRLFDWRY